MGLIKVLDQIRVSSFQFLLEPFCTSKALVFFNIAWLYTSPAERLFFFSYKYPVADPD
jgi:hypothetical protein